MAPSLWAEAIVLFEGFGKRGAVSKADAFGDRFAGKAAGSEQSLAGIDAEL